MRRTRLCFIRMLSYVLHVVQSVLAPAFEEMRTPYASGREICAQKCTNEKKSWHVLWIEWSQWIKPSNEFCKDTLAWLCVARSMAFTAPFTRHFPCTVAKPHLGPISTRFVTLAPWTPLVPLTCTTMITWTSKRQFPMPAPSPRRITCTCVLDIEWGLRPTIYLLSNPFIPRVINFTFPLQPHQKCHITQYGELGFYSLLRWQMNRLPIWNYITYTCLSKRLGECTSWTWEWKG